MMRNNCGRCHECGARLKKVLDGEEWCPACGRFRRYRSHGWNSVVADVGNMECPNWDKMKEGESK